ncbi:hypothetical protein ACFL5M_06130 [Candidatus Neomarinimicrobiota bacterium]
MTEAKKSDRLQKLKDLFISGTFRFIDSRALDSKSRITLGGSLTKALEKLGPVESFDMFIDEKGHVLLVPMQHIPASEMWTWTNGEIRASFDRANEDIVEGRVTEVTDLDAFLDEL